MGSLKDQLLKAGLVSKEDTRKPKQRKQPTKPKKKRAQVGEATLRAQRAMLDKAKKDKRLNEERAKEAARKAKIAEIKQLIDANKLDRKDGDVAYHFTYAKKVKKLYVTSEQQKQLAHDQIGIVTLGNEVFDLVPKIVANKILERDQNFVVKEKKEKPKEQDVEDPYAGYEIPDDLSW